jgi:hypothetical protein
VLEGKGNQNFALGQYWGKQKQEEMKSHWIWPKDREGKLDSKVSNFIHGSLA